jgi:ribosomal protein L11 methyltransferase
VTNLWYEITATTPPELTDAVAALMRDVSPGGVTIEEPIDILGPEMGFRVRTGEPNLVRAWLPSSELGAVLVSDLRTAMQRLPRVELSARPIYEQDWAVNWREFFGVVETGGRLIVVPTWIDHVPLPGQIVIRLDPGRAFGTGHHETSRLCLRALERHVGRGASVFDLGTGSGILAIAAKLLGAGRVLAVDIDPTAAEVARENADANGVEVEIRAGSAPARAEQFDLVVANISAQANIGLAPLFEGVVKPGGILILSGLLEENVDEVSGAMASAFERLGVEIERDWALIEFERLPR